MVMDGGIPPVLEAKDPPGFPDRAVLSRAHLVGRSHQKEAYSESMRKLLLAGLWCGLALAQVAPRPVPPPRPPEEPLIPATVRLEVQVWRHGQPAAGISLWVFRIGPGGRLLPAGLGPSLRITGPQGKASWSGIPEGNWAVQLRDPQSGLLLSVPVTEDFMAAPLVIGPYQIEIHLNQP